MSAPIHPIEIIGGGLAGLALGLALRRAGVEVTIYEAGQYPRHRVCGEFITGLESETISRLGLGPFLAGALHHREVAWFLDDRVRPARIQHLPAPALGLSRHALDARLADAFVAEGGVLRTQTRVTDLAPRAGRVLASGRRRARSPWLGLKIHVRGLTIARDLELHLGENAYVGLARIETDEVNVCGLFHRRAIASQGADLLLDYLRAAGLTTLAARVACATVAPESFCAVAAVGFGRVRLAHNQISLGDAAALIPPFTGNGMAMAFQSAESALDPLLEFSRGALSWSDTCRAVNTALQRRFRVRLATADALHSFLLTRPRQRWLRALNRARLLPLRPLYAALH
jgi:flavin-dependent dehydrogenase